MDAAALFRTTAATANRAVLPLLRTRLGRRALKGSFATISYQGRRSGRQVSLPVNYRRGPDGSVVIRVLGPDAKRWWRNFTGAGAPVRVRIGAEERAGHATATRSPKGAVTVRIVLE